MTHTPHPAPVADADGRTTLETALAALPVGCTILIHRTDNGEWYKLLLRDDMEFASYEGGWVKLENMAGMVAYAIELELPQPPTPASEEA